MSALLQALATLAVCTLGQYLVINALSTRPELVNYRQGRKATPYQIVSYIICNVFKACILCWAWCLPVGGALDVVIAVLGGRTIPGKVLHPLATAYFITDASALFLNKFMKTDTVIHHIGTSMLGVIFLCASDFHVAYHPVIWFAVWSALAYTTNGFLALRQYKERDEWTRTRTLAFWLYIVAIVINWGMQPLLFYRIVQQTGLLLTPWCIFQLILFATFLIDDLALVSKMGERGISPAPTIAQHATAAQSKLRLWQNAVSTRAQPLRIWTVQQLGIPLLGRIEASGSVGSNGKPKKSNTLP